MGFVPGFSPDMHVMDLHGNHLCYLWDHADIHEYLDVSDWESLTAPRPLLVETGRADPTFSSRTPPFPADKQLTRRGRAAYGPDAGKLIHYLHYDVHHFHVAAANQTNPGRPRASWPQRSSTLLPRATRPGRPTAAPPYAARRSTT